ncbi:MAG: glycosyltransferase family 2 protein [Pseudomonadota bacterium]
MLQTKSIGVVIPALNEAGSIARVIADLPDYIDTIVVADNGSTDDTARIAAEAGAHVARAKRRGYGSACLAGLAALPAVDIVVFIDGDYSDYPQQADRLLAPLLAGSADLVIGSRTLGNAAAGSLSVPQVFGNWLATRLIRLIWGVAYTDLGPFRAICANALTALEMRDPDFGWTVEMQIKAARLGLRHVEVPVDYRQRIGTSKISGSLIGSARAGFKILGWIGAVALHDTFVPDTRSGATPTLPTDASPPARSNT